MTQPKVATHQSENSSIHNNVDEIINGLESQLRKVVVIPNEIDKEKNHQKLRVVSYPVMGPALFNDKRPRKRSTKRKLQFLFSNQCSTGFPKLFTATSI